MDQLDKYLIFLFENKDHRKIKKEVKKIRKEYDSLHKRTKEKYNEELNKLSEDKKREIIEMKKMLKKKFKDQFLSLKSPFKIKSKLDERIREISNDYRFKSRMILNNRDQELNRLQLERKNKISAYLTSVGLISTAYTIGAINKHNKDVEKAEKSVRRFKSIQKEINSRND